MADILYKDFKTTILKMFKELKEKGAYLGGKIGQKVLA